MLDADNNRFIPFTSISPLFSTALHLPTILLKLEKNCSTAQSHTLPSPVLSHMAHWGCPTLPFVCHSIPSYSKRKEKDNKERDTDVRQMQPRKASHSRCCSQADQSLHSGNSLSSSLFWSIGDMSQNKDTQLQMVQGRHKVSCNHIGRKQQNDSRPHQFSRKQDYSVPQNRNSKTQLYKSI